MTLGFFMPSLAAFAGLSVVVIHLMQLRKLPTRAEQGYDESVAARTRAHRISIGAGLALPLLVYAALHLFAGDLVKLELL